MSLSALGGVMEWWGGGWLWASGARCLGGGCGPTSPPPKGMTHFDGLAPLYRRVHPHTLAGMNARPTRCGVTWAEGPSRAARAETLEGGGSG